MPEISKTAQVLKYFAQRYQARARKGIERTRLVKMAYMSDLLAREYLGDPITDFQYIRYIYGPYDDAIVSAIKELVDAEMAEEQNEFGDDYASKRLIGRGAPLAFDFSPAESEILSYVAKNYMEMPLKELLYDVVYETPPMLEETRFEHPLPMNIVDNRGTEAVGFRLDDVLIAEQEIAAGKFATDF